MFTGSIIHEQRRGRPASNHVGRLVFLVFNNRLKNVIKACFVRLTSAVSNFLLHEGRGTAAPVATEGVADLQLYG